MTIMMGCLLDFPPLWRPAEENKAPSTTTAASRTGSLSSILLPVSMNVYPLGYYSVSLNIGRPPKAYGLDIDTGSDLTWVQCDVSRVGCTKPCDRLYKPGNNLVCCDDPLCTALHSTGYQPCKETTNQCDYEVEYADQGSSLGILVNDIFPLRLTNGSTLIPRLAFGGMIRNVSGHCLSSRGGGFRFFGDDLVSSSKMAWTPMLSASSAMNDLSEPADLIYDRKHLNVSSSRIYFQRKNCPVLSQKQDISWLNMVVIYDNEKKQISWAPVNCHRLPMS